MLCLGVGEGQPGIPPHLFADLIHAADHAELETAAGGRIRNTFVEPHEIHCPSSDIHEQHGRLIPQQLRMNSQSRIALWKQLHILNGDSVWHALKFEAYRRQAVLRLFRIQEILSKCFFLSAEQRQGQPGPNRDRALCFFTALSDFFRYGRKGQEAIIAVFCFVSKDWLSAGAADKILPAVLQRVLQRVRFVGVSGDTGWEGKMSCFHGRIAMIDPDVHDETPPL